MMAGFKGNLKLPLRINLYNLDAEGLPNENILKQPIVFTPNSARMKWYEFDISDQQIQFPEDGLCISMEFLIPSVKDYKLTDNFMPYYMRFHKPGSVLVHRTTWIKWIKVPESIGALVASVEAEVD